MNYLYIVLYLFLGHIYFQPLSPPPSQDDYHLYSLRPDEGITDIFK